jgi:hypothetical protein
MIRLNEELASSPTFTLARIETLTINYSIARATLAEAVTELNDEIEQLKRKRLSRIKTLLGMAADHHAKLSAAVQTSPHLFDKPKSQTFAGIKVGFRKGTGGIDWDDADKVVALIEKHFPKAQAELLIKTTKKPIAKALADLGRGRLETHRLPGGSHRRRGVHQTDGQRGGQDRQRAAQGSHGRRRGEGVTTQAETPPTCGARKP